MTSLAELSARFYSYNKMYSFESRQKSFADWPFREECQCTPEMVRSIMSCFAFKDFNDDRQSINNGCPAKVVYTFLIFTSFCLDSMLTLAHNSSFAR